MLSRRILCSLVILLLVPAALGQTWTEVRSPNFIVVTDAGQGREVAQRFEQMRGIFGAIFHRKDVNLPVPLTIIAFRDGSELKANAPANDSAVFIGGEDCNYLAIDMSAPDKWSVALHQFAHMLLDGNYPRTQPWFDEGFAEYLAATRISKQAELGPQPPSAAELAKAQLMPVVQLFGMQQNAKLHAQSSRERQLFYAQSWLVVHWILDTHKMGELGQYFNLAMNRKVPISDAIQQAFGMSAQEVDQQLNQYRRTAGGITAINLPSMADSNSYASRKLNDTQAKAYFGELHAHIPERQAQGIEELKQVIASAPENALAHRALGIALLRTQNVPEASEHIRRAVSLDDRDPRAHYYNAVSLNGGSQTNIQVEGRARQMIFELQKAVELDPSYADAYSLIARAQMALDKPDAALTAARRAVEFSPRNEHFLLNMAQIQARLGDVDHSQAILRLLQNSSDPEMAAQALRALSTVSTVAKQQQRWAEQGISTSGDPTDPRWRPKDNKPKEEEPAEPVEEKPDLRKIEFLKGVLVAVSCGSGQAATVTLSSAGKTWQFKTADRSKLLLMGADQFSCEWKNVNVAVNYRRSGPTQGDLVSIEVQ